MPIRIVILLLSVLLSGLGHAERLHIAVASNFSPTLHKLADTFQQQQGHRVLVSAASSGKHYAQLRHGAPYDVFFSADQVKPQALINDGLAVEASRFTYAIGQLALWQPVKTNTAATTSLAAVLQQLSSGQFQTVAVANPKLAPYGLASQQVLKRIGYRPGKRSKQIIGENIAQTFQFLSTGNASIGLVAQSQILQLKGMAHQGQSHRIWSIPDEWHAPINQDVVQLKRSLDNKAVHDFLVYIHSPAAKAIIQADGYNIP